MSEMNSVKVTAVATTAATSPPFLEVLLSRRQNSREALLKPPSLSGTVAVKDVFILPAELVTFLHLST